MSATYYSKTTLLKNNDMMIATFDAGPAGETHVSFSVEIDNEKRVIITFYGLFDQNQINAILKAFSLFYDLKFIDEEKFLAA